MAEFDSTCLASATGKTTKSHGGIEEAQEDVTNKLTRLRNFHLVMEDAKDDATQPERSRRREESNTTSSDLKSIILTFWKYLHITIEDYTAIYNNRNLLRNGEFRVYWYVAACPYTVVNLREKHGVFVFVAELGVEEHSAADSD